MNPKSFVKETISAYNNYSGIFKIRKNAEDMLPSGLDPKTQAVFLFFVISIDYATKSQSLYKGARDLYKANPDFYNCRTINQMSEEELKQIMTTYLRPRYINEAIFRYKTNSEMLIHLYQANPISIFESVISAKDTLAKIRAFRGFGPKIGNFFFRTIVNLFDYSFEDIDEVLPPVDIHDVRIAYLMGYINSIEMSQKNILMVKRLWNQACKDAKESWLIFDKALWLLGSEGSPKSKSDVLKLLTN